MTESELIATGFICMICINAISVFWLWRLEACMNNNAVILEAVRDRVQDLSNDIDAVVKMLGALSQQQKALDDSMNGLAFNGDVLVASGDDVRLVDTQDNEMNVKIVKD